MLERLVRPFVRQGLVSPWFFRNVVRPLAYRMAKGDPERVHELALGYLRSFEKVVESCAGLFDVPELYVDLRGRKVMPFGTAAGFDKNGDALAPLSCLFGFLEPGTVVREKRDGNLRPRVAVDDGVQEIYNAQGFPHKGLEYFIENVRGYRGKAPLLVSVCGIPKDKDDLAGAQRDLAYLVGELAPFAHGFVWNPFSPNTEALRALRSKGQFEESARLIGGLAPGKLKLVKMGPYEEAGRNDWLALVEGWVSGGGDGVVAVNTYLTPKEKMPVIAWGYPSGGRSGTFLREYRNRAVRDVRQEFPDAFIIATGGIGSGDEAWSAFEAGADALEGYTPYAFQGLGLRLELQDGVMRKLRERGYSTLAEYQRRERNGG